MAVDLSEPYYVDGKLYYKGRQMKYYGRTEEEQRARIDSLVQRQRASFTGFMRTYQRTPTPTPTTPTELEPIIYGQEPTPTELEPITYGQPTPTPALDTTETSKEAQPNPIWWLPIIAIILILIAWLGTRRKKRIRW